MPYAYVTVGGSRVTVVFFDRYAFALGYFRAGYGRYGRTGLLFSLLGESGKRKYAGRERKGFIEERREIRVGGETVTTVTTGTTPEYSPL
jgi:hypothetical protein